MDVILITENLTRLSTAKDTLIEVADFLEIDVTGDRIEVIAEKILNNLNPPVYEGVDVEGLQGLGWTDEDIADFEASLPDGYEAPKVTSVDEQCYKDYMDGTFTVPNFGGLYSMNFHYPGLVYCPKFNLSGRTSMESFFYGCTSLVGVPQFDTSSATNFEGTFSNCTSLVTIPLLATSSATNMYGMFQNCTSLVTVPLFDTSGVTTMNSMFRGCSSLRAIPLFDTSSVTSMGYMCAESTLLVNIPLLDISNVTSTFYMFSKCWKVKVCNLNGAKENLDFSDTSKLEADSLVYIIDNAQTVDSKTLTLGTTNLAKLTDEQIAVATAKGWTVS